MQGEGREKGWKGVSGKEGEREKRERMRGSRTHDSENSFGLERSGC